MLTPAHRTILQEVLSLPTAPFAEGRVDAYISAFCRNLNGVRLTRDKAGNLLVHYRRGRNRIRRPVCLAAHMDHPGFIAKGMIGRNRLRAAWHGGVRPAFFKRARVRFRVDERWVRGEIRSIRTTGKGAARRVRTADVAVITAVPAGAIGMWDFPDARIRGDRIYARGTDDLAGVAALLCCLETLSRRRADAEAYFLFTRAEEVGFVGAIAACRNRTIPARCVVVAVENSAELPDARVGDGPILRVGDKASTFTPAATAFCGSVAQQLARRNRKFTYQRKLMDGGTCESAAYCQLGYDATGICIALGNYHNMNRRTGRLGPESVHLSDVANLIRWFVALATTGPGYAGADAGLVRRLRKIERRYALLLRETSPSGTGGISATGLPSRS